MVILLFYDPKPFKLNALEGETLYSPGSNSCEDIGSVCTKELEQLIITTYRANKYRILLPPNL